MSLMAVLAMYFPSSAVADSDTAASISVDAGKTVGKLDHRLFGVAIPRLSGEPWRPPTPLESAELIRMMRELKPGFLTIDNTQLGFPFYLDSVGSAARRAGALTLLERVGVQRDDLGSKLYALAKNNAVYRRNPVPHISYDDMLGFIGKIDPNIPLALRVPIIFSDVQGEWQKLRIDIDPKTGGDLVHYLNDPPDTSYGSARAANGRRTPYGIKYFVLGNEFWSPYSRGNLEISQIAKQVVAFAQAMKAADPSISVGINLVDDSYPHEFFKPGKNPNEERLLGYNEQILSAVGNHLDFVTYHSYGGIALPSLAGPISREQWLFLMAQNHLREKYGSADRHRRVFARFRNGLEMAVDEYNGPAKSLGGALYNADYLMYLIQNGYSYATQWSLGLTEPDADLGMLRIIQRGGATKIIRRPTYWAHSLLSNYSGNTLLDVAVKSPVFEAGPLRLERYFDWPREPEIPCLKAMGSLDGDDLYIAVINRDLQRDITARIDISHFKLTAAIQSYTLTASSIDTTNEDDEDLVAVHTASITPTSQPLEHMFPKHSLTILKIPGGVTLP